MRLLLVGAIAAMTAACSHTVSSRNGSDGAAVLLEPAGAAPVRVAVEVARSGPARERGLMFRDHLAADSGMLFLFEQSQHLTFWMKNTYIPLDMIFISSDKKVVGIVENAVPLTTDPREVDGDSQFVLEVAGGWAASHRIAPGTPVEFVDVQ